MRLHVSFLHMSNKNREIDRQFSWADSNSEDKMKTEDGGYESPEANKEKITK